MQAGVAWLSPERQPFLCRPACQNTATCVCRCSGPSPAGSQTKQPAPETDSGPVFSILADRVPEADEKSGGPSAPPL